MLLSYTPTYSFSPSSSLSSFTYLVTSAQPPGNLYISNGDRLMNSGVGYEVFTTNTTTYCRLNLNLGSSVVIDSILYTTIYNNGYNVNMQNARFIVYASNSVTAYNDTTLHVSNLTLLGSTMMSTTFTIAIPNISHSILFVLAYLYQYPLFLLRL